MQSTKALSKFSLYASLVQDIVKRMQKCDKHTQLTERADVLSLFAQKIVNYWHEDVYEVYVRKS